MATFTNNSVGMRGINLKTGGIAWLDVGQSIDLDKDDILGTLPDLGRPSPAAAQIASADSLLQIEELEDALITARAEISELQAAVAARDAQIASLSGGPKPVALTGKNKEALMQIAADEGVTIEDGATNSDIIAAIELHREASAQG